MRMHAHAEKIQPSTPVMELSVKQTWEEQILLFEKPGSNSEFIWFPPHLN